MSEGRKETGNRMQPASVTKYIEITANPTRKQQETAPSGRVWGAI